MFSTFYNDGIFKAIKLNYIFIIVTLVIYVFNIMLVYFAS